MLRCFPLSKMPRLYMEAFSVVFVSFSACSANTQEPDLQSPLEAEAETEVPSLIPPLPTERPSTAQFSDVLSEYQLMNDRLERVSAPLRLANATLCKKTFRDPGFSTHVLEDYPETLRDVAKEALGLDEGGIYVRRVRPGSPAASADIEAGDSILSLNGQFVPGGTTMKRFYSALSRGAFGGVKTRLKLLTPSGSEYETTLRSETACDFETHVFYSRDINGHTDGQDVFITSELMRFVGDDNNLALIVAHEMAHAIAGHIDEISSAELELDADRMALVMMENAGYDIQSAIDYWTDASHPHRDLQDNSDSHPSITARFENFKKELARIEKMRARYSVIPFGE